MTDSFDKRSSGTVAASFEALTQTLTDTPYREATDSFLGRPRLGPVDAQTMADRYFATAAEAISTATRRFCLAVESGDFDQMQLLWERTRRVSCVLVDRPIRRGWQAVANELMYALATPAHIVVANMAITIEGQTAWVTYDCDRIDTTCPASSPILGVASTTFAATRDEWFIVAHHASLVKRF